MKGTVFAVALNHRSQIDAWHQAFQQAPYNTPPKTAVWFIKPRNTVIRDGEAIPHPEEETLLSGATVALVVGKTASRVSVAEAADYIAGFALANEVSLPEESFYRPAIKAKCRDGFCPLGELVPLSHVDNLTIITDINGREADRWSTADLQRSAAELLCALSEFATLQPGDVILLGTPQQRVTLQPGDHVRVLAEGFPPLENHVVAERDITETRTFSPQPHPHGTLFALGLNYADHASELDFKPPEEPLVFIKAANSFTGDKQTSVRPDNVEYMHYEAELVVVIGKTARKVSRETAMDYVAGYTLCNDYAIRDYLENYYRPNLRVKSRDTLTPIAPWIVDKSAIPDPHNLTLRTWVNGELRQQGTTADLIFDVPFLIEYLSSFMTLHPGDMIATGTPKGLSDVVPGDEVVVEVEGIGRLVNRIVSQQEHEEMLK
jgi:5-oxopent-3-ene-1,2,5-tricarboxylate decarboxylase/2-hydroxyhepta-2,4-diene-1,7-dioate isomerase